MSQGFHASLYQIAVGYRHFRGASLPRTLPFVTAGNALIRDFGRERVKAVLRAIPNDASEADALAAAQAADSRSVKP
jgi:hypothetical protein